MCQGDAAPKQRTEGSLKEAGQLFLKHTTFHGLRHVFLSGSYPRRVAWLLAFLTALALLFTWSSNRVRYLLSSPVYSKAQMVYAKRLVFPAVTICNQNILMPRRMKKPDIFSAGRWLGLFGKNWQVSPAVREALTSHVDGTNNEPPWSPFSLSHTGLQPLSASSSRLSALHETVIGPSGASAWGDVALL